MWETAILGCAEAEKAGLHLILEDGITEICLGVTTLGGGRKFFEWSRRKEGRWYTGPERYRGIVEEFAKKNFPELWL